MSEFGYRSEAAQEMTDHPGDIDAEIEEESSLDPLRDATTQRDGGVSVVTGPDGAPAVEPILDGAPGQDTADTGEPDAGTDADPPDAAEAGTHPEPGACTPGEPLVAIVDGFEDLTDDTPVAQQAGDRWRLLSEAQPVGFATSAWVKSCSRTLFVQGSGRTLYRPLSLPPSVTRLNLSLSYASSGGDQDLAEFGLATLGNGVLSKLMTIDAVGSSFVATSASTAADIRVGQLQIGSRRPAHNDIRVELDFHERTARVFVGTGAVTPVTLEIAGDLPNAFYISAGVASTYVDDLVIATPCTPIDRDALCAASLIDTFTSPGSRCSGLGWTGDSLWILDNLKRLYRRAPGSQFASPLTLSFNGYGLSWDGTGFWTRNGSQISHVRPNGVTEPGPSIFAHTDSQGLWYRAEFWVVDLYRASVWSTTGQELRNWEFSPFDQPSGILVKDDKLYTIIGLIKGPGESDPAIAVYPLTGGGPLALLELTQLGLPRYTGMYSLASDGDTYWICSESDFIVHHVRLPF